MSGRFPSTFRFYKKYLSFEFYSDKSLVFVLHAPRIRLNLMALIIQILQTSTVTVPPAATAYVAGRVLQGSVYDAARTKPSEAGLS